METECWLAVDEDGTETVFSAEPVRRNNETLGKHWANIDKSFISLPKGSVFKLIGKELTWDDEPFKYEGN